MKIKRMMRKTWEMMEATQINLEGLKGEAGESLAGAGDK